MRLTILVMLVLFTVPVIAEDPSTFDQRFGVVATDGSGWNDPVMPMQGPQFFEPLRTAWWYNYTPRIQSYQVPGLSLFWPGYQRLYMFWRAGGDSDATIQEYARAAKAADPNRIIWWAMSNEPNDRGQANQTGAGYAAIYLKYHKNLRIGDPACKIMGCGLLDWKFTNSSCYQTGKAWYEEFRNAWAANPDCVAYSQSVNGTNYPPQDAFCLHSYAIRWPADWRWCRDDLTACHNDLQTYPETQGLKIWNTEWGDLTSPSRAQGADMVSALALWMRQQPWIERWFLFFTHSDNNGTWPNLELFDNDGAMNQLGRVYRDISLLPMDANYFHYPYHATYDLASDNVRTGWAKSILIGETLNAPGLKFYLNNGVSYSANTMRGRRFSANNGAIYKMRFNYLKNYDNANCVLAMDTQFENDKWQSNTFGASTDYVELDFSDDPVAYVSFGLHIKSPFTYSYNTGEWLGVVSNVMLLTCPHRASVTDEGSVTVSSTHLGAQWTVPIGGKQPVTEYEYAIGTTSKGTDVVGWTSVGTARSVSRDDLTLADDVTYYISVRAKDSQGIWGAIGSSNGIRKIPCVSGPYAAKALPVGSWCGMQNVVVTGIFKNRFYVEQEDRSAGIGVSGTTTAQIGDRVTVGGQIGKLSGETVIVGGVCP